MVSALLAALLALSGAAPPAASPCDRFERARELLKAGQPDAALPIFEACLTTNPEAPEVRWRAQLGVALSHDLAGRPVAAARYYDVFMHDSRWTESSEWLQRRADAARELERLEPIVLKTHGILTVTSTPTGARAQVFLERRAVATGETPMRVILGPGTYRVEVQTELQLLARDLDLAAGRRLELDLTMADPPPDTGPKDPPPPDPVVVVPEEPPPVEESPGPWIMLGVGAGSVVAGAIAAGVMASRVDEYESLVPESYRPEVNQRAQGLADEIHALQPTYIALLGVGAALLTGAVVWRVIGDQEEAASAPPSVGVGTDGRGLVGTVSGRF